MVSILTKSKKKAPRNPALRHSEARKMETNCPRDLELGLKILILFGIKDVLWNYFYKIGAKRSPFYTKGQKSSTPSLKGP